MRRILLVALLALLALGSQQLAGQLSPPAAEAIDIEAVIWQFGKDYPGADGDDTKLPLRTVYIKTHDATNWMSTYDEDPKAVSGPASIRRLIDDYGAQGIEVVAWFVPKGGDIDRQVEMATQVLDSGVTALYADVEPFEGFCDLECGYLANELWWRVRQERPGAKLGVIYDPRPWTWAESATWSWLAAADVALPMCYWEMFVDQEAWSDPAGCVSQAYEGLGYLAPGRSLEYIPMLQGDTTPERFLQAMDAARAAGATKVSIWRRGVVANDVWEAAWAIYEPPAQVAATWPSYWQWSPCPWDGCILREASSPALYVLYAGAKFHIPSPEALAAMGRSPADHWIVGDGMMSRVADVPWDGTLVQEAGSEGVYVVYAGARFPIPSPEALNAIGLGAQRVYRVPPGAVATLPSIPREGSRFRELSGGPDWQMTAGARFAVPSPEVAAALTATGSLEELVYVVPDGALAQVPLQPRDRTRVRELSSPTEWQIAAGARFPLPSAAERNKLVHAKQLEWHLSVVPDGGLAGVPTVLRDGSHVRELDGAVEWQVVAGTKIALVDGPRRDALIAAGQLSQEPFIVPNGTLAGLPEGPVEGAVVKEPGSDVLFVVRCGSLYKIADSAQLERLVTGALARLPILTVAGPLAAPETREGNGCVGGALECSPRGWGLANPFAPLGCRPRG
ncbi:MAG TPA: hypothetical protein VGR43_09885 [Dehalococcoidia bacterium]|nr:hypothetical protein [Dehalococcoidia bacterium]